MPNCLECGCEMASLVCDGCGAEVQPPDAESDYRRYGPPEVTQTTEEDAEGFS